MTKSWATFCCSGTYKDYETKVLRNLGCKHYDEETKNGLYVSFSIFKKLQKPFEFMGIQDSTSLG